MWEVDPETRSKLAQIQKKDGSGNERCCDCGAPSPQWASPKFSTFICLTCAGTHRGLGVHISFVRSISMDAFKQNEIIRMQQGGNKAWQDFYNQKSSTPFQVATIKERYDCEVGEEWKERLSAKVEGKSFDEATWMEERKVTLQRQAERSATPMGSQPTPGNRSESPANGKMGLPPGQKARNENYFAKMGQANASRPDALAPSQGGKYAGFGSAPPEPQGQQAGIPSADEFQKDPVAALTKGFGWFSAAVGKQAKMVNDAYIQPTAKNLAASDIAAQARTVAAQAGQGLQSGAKGAAETFNKFVDGQDERTGVAGRRNAEPERKDFWDSFGASAESANPSSIGTSAVRGGAKGPSSGTSKGKEDGWDDW